MNVGGVWAGMAQTEGDFSQLKCASRSFSGI